MNLPLAAATLFATPPESVGETEGAFDLPETTTVFLGIAALVFGLVEAGNSG